MNILVTGATGFIGTHLVEYISNLGHKVIPLSHGKSEQSSGSIYRGDIQDTGLIKRIVESEKIETVFHLAGKNSSSSVEELFKTNILGTQAILETIRSVGRPIRILVLGSSAVYGDVKFTDPVQTKICETTPYSPVTYYGVSKAATDQIARLNFLESGLPIIRVHPFNVIGPGQNIGMVVSTIAHQLAQIECEKKSPLLSLGNTNTFRDFVDVRDVVKALWLLANRGEPGELYNIASGRATEIKYIVNYLVKLTGKQITIESNLPRKTCLDIPYQCGSFEKIQAHIGWKPEIELNSTLEDILQFWRDYLEENQ